jgi:hypothetical protein
LSLPLVVELLLKATHEPKKPMGGTSEAALLRGGSSPIRFSELLDQGRQAVQVVLPHDRSLVALRSLVFIFILIVFLIVNAGEEHEESVDGRLPHGNGVVLQTR